MPPKLLSDDGKNIVIRPLAYCKEADIAEFSRLMEFPIIPCNLCGSQENLQRQVVKEMLQDWEKKHPGRLETMFHAVTSVAPSHLADRDLFDFAGLDEQRDRFQASRIDALDMSSEQAGMADDLFEAERRVKPLADSAASLGHEL